MTKARLETCHLNYNLFLFTFSGAFQCLPWQAGIHYYLHTLLHAKKKDLAVYRPCLSASFSFSLLLFSLFSSLLLSPLPASVAAYFRVPTEQ